MRGRISPDIKEQILDRTDLVGLIEEYTQLRRAGARYMGLCPFPTHKDKDPSFSVSPENGFYYCFGCKEHGNAISFVQKMQGLSFVEAMEFLARRAGVVIPETDSAQARLRDSQLEVLEEAARYYEAQLRSGAGAGAREILRGRGVTDAMIERFRLGFAPPGWENVGPALRRKGARDHDLRRVGLVIARKDGDGSYDRLRNRIVFPILSPMGKVIAFGGRKIDPEDEPKYLNSPETDLFKKGATLYGYNLARASIQATKEVIVVEGYMDVIALHQYGFENAVGSLGTALTPMHWKVLRRQTERVHLLFDADAAGRKATVHGIDILLAEDVSPYVVELEDGTDPDSFLQARGAEAFRERLAGAKESIDYRLDVLLGGEAALEGEGQVQAIRSLIPLLSAMRNTVRRTQWVRRAARRLRVREEDLFAELARLGAPGKDAPRVLASQDAGPDPAQKAKQDLIALLLLGKPVHAIVRQLLGEAPGKDRLDEILERLVELTEGSESPSIGRLERGLDSDAVRIVSEIANRSEPVPEKYLKAAKDYAQVIRQSYIAALDGEEREIDVNNLREEMARLQQLHERKIRLGMGEGWRH